MDMDPAKTDKLIARAIAGLPYRRPSIGFAARVMAEIAVVRQAERWQDCALKAAGLTVAAWAALLAFAGAKLAYAKLPEITAFFMQPGGVSSAIKLLAARLALFCIKLAAAASFGADLAAAAAGYPGYYEIAAAAVICAGAVAALSGRRAEGRI